MEIKLGNGKEYKLNNTHLNKFKKFSEKYIKDFGLVDWERFYTFTDDMHEAMAACAADLDGRLAMMILSQKWKLIEPTDYELKQAALHEVLELLLWELCTVVKQPHATDENINSVRHAVIRRIEEVLN